MDTSHFPYLFIHWWELELLLFLSNCNNAAWNIDTKISQDPDFHSFNLNHMVILPLSFWGAATLFPEWLSDTRCPGDLGDGSVGKTLTVKHGDLSLDSISDSKGRAWQCLSVIPALEGRGRDGRIPGTHKPRHLMSSKFRERCCLQN